MGSVTAHAHMSTHTHALANPHPHSTPTHIHIHIHYISAHTYTRSHQQPYDPPTHPPNTLTLRYLGQHRLQKVGVANAYDLLMRVKASSGRQGHDRQAHGEGGGGADAAEQSRGSQREAAVLFRSLFTFTGSAGESAYMRERVHPYMCVRASSSTRRCRPSRQAPKNARTRTFTNAHA